MRWHQSVGEWQTRSKSRVLLRRLSVASCLLLALTTRAQGQALELGGSLGTAARGSESSLVTSPWNPSLGVYASVLWTERLETTFRVAWVQQGSRQSSAGYFVGCESVQPPCRAPLAFSIVERSNAPLTFITGSAQFNFRPREVVRPFVGLGVGVTRNSTHVTCEPVSVSCDEVASDFRLGRRVSVQRGLVAIAGVAATFRQNYVGRATVSFHRPGGEDSSLFETALTVGYRF